MRLAKAAQLPPAPKQHEEANPSPQNVAEEDTQVAEAVEKKVPGSKRGGHQRVAQGN